MKCKNYLLAGLLLLGCCAEAKTTLFGETSEPRANMFYQGEKIYLYFTATGLQPRQKGVYADLEFRNHDDKLLRKHRLHIEVNNDGVGCGNIDASWLLPQLGFYRVYATLSDGTTLPAIGSRPAGFLTYAIMRDPKELKVYTMDYTHFMTSGGGWRNFMGTAWSNNCGIGQWRHLEEQKFGQYSENPNADKICLRSSLKKLGPVKPGEIRNDYGIANLYSGSSSKWPATEEYFTPSSLNSGLQVPHKKGMEYWRKYCDVFSKNYSKQYADFPHHLYQILWEKDPVYGKTTWEDFINIYKTAYEAIHKNDPKAVILAMPNDLEENLRAGLWKYFDGISNHSYINFPVEQNGLIKRCRDTFALIRKYTGKDMPVYGTEYGYCTWGLKEKEPVQMYGMVRGFLIMLGEGWKSNSIFFNHDYRGELGFGINYNLSYGANGNDWGAARISPKPAVPALSAMIHNVEGHVSAGAIEYLGETAWGYAYQAKDGHVVLALWDYSGKPCKVEIPVGRDEIMVSDMMGNLTKYRTNRGMLSLTLTEAPLYVQDVDPGIWGRNAVRTVKTDKNDMTAMPGEEIVVSGKVNAASKDLNGYLEAIPEKKSKLASRKMKVSLKKGETKNFSFNFKIPGTLKLGRYPIILRFVENGKAIASGGINLEVQAPVDVVSVLPVFDKKTGLAVTLKNKSEAKAAGNIDIRIVGNPEGRGKLPFEINPGTTKTFTYFYDEIEVNPLIDVIASLDITLNTGYAFHAEREINILFAKYRPDLKSDSPESAWKDIPAMQLDPTPIRNAQFHTGKNDLSATMKIAWNDDGLQFLIVADDDAFVQKWEGWGTWMGDCIQMAFTKIWRMKSTENSYLDKLNRSHVELDFALTKKGSEGYRTVTFDNAAHPITYTTVKETQQKIEKIDLPDGRVRVVYHIGISWPTLGIARITGNERLGWTININDRDSVQRDVQRDPSAIGAFSLKNPMKFGMITLIK